MRFASLLMYLTISGVTGFAQNAGSSALTFGVGGAFPANGFRVAQFHNGPAFNADYELRAHKYFSVNVGADNYVLNFNNSGRMGRRESLERVTVLPFGLRGILPLQDSRVELFGGGGAAYVWSSASDFHCCGGESWLWQVNAGARVSLDPEKRFFVGTTAKYFQDWGRPTQQWSSWTADFGFRYGR
jgi:hypothetical protein